MEPWVSRNRPGMQLAAGIGAFLIGAILLWALRDFGLRGGDALAGFVLGILLLVLGGASLFVSGTQTVTVDPRKRVIEVTDKRPFGSRTTAIPFRQVVRVSIGYLGKRSNFANTYYLDLHLADGRKFPLFAPGRFFEGASNRDVVDGWRSRLEEYLARARQREGTPCRNRSTSI